MDMKYYEPGDDTFIFLDILIENLRKSNTIENNVFLEIGTGSGYLTSKIQENFPKNFFISTDINKNVPRKIRKNKELIFADLLEPIRQDLVDVIFFNPPYVHTEFVTKRGIEASYEGGKNGREVIDNFINKLKVKIVFLLIIEVNKPDEVLRLFDKNGYDAKIIFEKDIIGEKIFIVKSNKRF